MHDYAVCIYTNNSELSYVYIIDLKQQTKQILLLHIPN